MSEETNVPETTPEKPKFTMPVDTTEIRFEAVAKVTFNYEGGKDEQFAPRGLVSLVEKVKSMTSTEDGFKPGTVEITVRGKNKDEVESSMTAFTGTPEEAVEALTSAALPLEAALGEIQRLIYLAMLTSPVRGAIVTILSDAEQPTGMAMMSPFADFDVGDSINLARGASTNARQFLTTAVPEEAMAAYMQAQAAKAAGDIKLPGDGHAQGDIIIPK